MNASISFLRKAAIVGALSLVASAASAAVIYTNVGPISAPAVSNSFGTNQQLPGTITDQSFFFQLTSAATSISANYNFQPVGGMVSGGLYNATSTGATNGAAIATLAATGDSSNYSLNATFSFVVGNYYALAITQTAAPGNTNTTFSGQIVTKVPAPAVLGLVGIGLLGLGLARKVRRS
jgi:hypothetical protein